MEPTRPQADDDRRRLHDRRARPTRVLDGFVTPARRWRHRRTGDAASCVVVDRHDPFTVLMVVALLLLTIADGSITLVLVNSHCEEANPLMAPLVERGAAPFLVVKYALTACGLPVLLAYRRHRMFGSRFRVGFVLPVLVGLYLTLLAYQFALLRAGPPWPSSGAQGRSAVS